jgi:hypothetical protein
MKRLVESVNDEGYEKLLGEIITLFCCRYIYTGKLVGVSEKSLLLSEAGIVYETGSFDNNEWSDMQKLPNDWNVEISSVESWGILK